MNNLVSALLKSRLSARLIGYKYSRSAGDETMYFTRKPKVVQFLKITLASDEFISEKESKIKRFAQPKKMNLSQNAE